MKKTLLLLTVIFNTILSFAQPLITNSSFEDWATRYTKLAPVGWQCDSVGLVTTSVKKYPYQVREVMPFKLGPYLMPVA